MLPIILEAIKLAGANGPAFKKLFDAAVSTLSPTDQETALTAYEDAMRGADDAHGGLQRRE